MNLFSQGDKLLFRFIGENVWLSQIQLDLIWEKLIICPMKSARPKNRKERYTIYEAYRPGAEAIVQTMFWGGLLGGELFNYYASFENPVTQKKLRVAKSELIYKNYMQYFL